MNVWNFLTKPLNTLRGQAVVGLLILTGITSMALGRFAADAVWAFPAQVGLVVVFVAGSALILSDEGGRLRVLAATLPGVGALILGLTVLPNWFGLLAGLSVGWFIAAMMLFRQQTQPEVLKTIRLMRKGRYQEAIDTIDPLIKRDRDNPEHYRLRAMVFRLNSQLDRAKRDYDQMLKLIPDGEQGDALRAEAYDGLSEVHLQARRFDAANEAALKAHDLYPDNWVPLYNLGLINDRRNNPEHTQTYLSQALEIGIPDQRQRLLAHLYMARALVRLGDVDGAKIHVEAMKNLWQGIEGLQKLLNDEQSAPLSAVIQDDVNLAWDLMNDEAEVAAL